MHVPPYIVFHKKRGQTPLQAIEEWKEAHPEFKDVPASYAGRLDPMAEGKLLVLLGEECKRKDAYTGLDKEYEVEIVLDLSTDSSDALGIASYAGVETHPSRGSIQTALRALTGPHLIPYPSFSSKTVNGKPLFMYTLEGTISEIIIPEHIENIYRARVLNVHDVSTHELRMILTRGLEVIPMSDDPSKALGKDFRQPAVRDAWHHIFEETNDRTWSLISLRVTCASGTYMRSLANRLAKEFDTTGFALSIKRTRIGRYRKLGPIGFWSKKY